ncbi:MAG TPA: lysylphosphatidylglycerol synthase domain-containing protein, partial [Synergistales bacterium]|nr:lysylphosphatidylglycerol synthase domain-containing protein [Synergistales bacterium]
METLSARTFLCALLLYGMTYPLRALRWVLLMGDHKSPGVLWEYTVITGIHTAATNFFPFRSGELAFPVLLKERGCPFSSSVIFLFMGRFMDLSVMLTLFAFFYLGPGAFFPVLIILTAIFSLRRKAFSLYERISGSMTFLRKFLDPL